MSRHTINACAVLEREAVARGVGPGVAERARRATRRAALRDPSMSARRLDAYFWAVVRRSSVRAPEGRGVVEKLVLDAVIDDLRQAGRGDEAIADELERGWRGVVAEAVLRDACARLCA